MSEPFPLPAHLVNLLLSYISPPSQLLQPLPPHLVSKPLLQRHHYLQLSPSNDLQAYLCWPSQDSQRAIGILECIQRPTHSGSGATYDIRYMSDEESIYAHVSTASDGARIIFQWEEDSWKYNDTKLMPFPLGTHAELYECTKTRQEFIINPELDDSSVGLNGEDEEDEYWSAYANQGNEDPEAQLWEARRSEGAIDNSEDAYWAQYASVQGSADSTRPSPRPEERRKSQIMPESALLQIPHSTIFPNFQTTFDPVDAASTDILTARLQQFLPQPGDSDLSFLSLSPWSSDQNTGTVSPSEQGSLEKVSLSGVSFVDDNQFSVGSGIGSTGSSLPYAVEVQPQLSSTPSTQFAMEPPPQSNDDLDCALRAVLKNVYRLWKTGKRKGDGVEQDTLESSDKDLFMRLVQDAIST